MFAISSFPVTLVCLSLVRLGLLCLSPGLFFFELQENLAAGLPNV